MPFRWPSRLLLLLLSPLTPVSALECSHIRVDEQSFNLEKLGGEKTVHDLKWEPPSIHNTTFSIDICENLKKPKGSSKGEYCRTGTRVCGKEYVRHGSEETLDKVIPIAGEYTASHGKHLDPKYTRLKNSPSNSDPDREGLIVELHGGSYTEVHNGKSEEVDQKAIIEFICNKSMIGNEGFEEQSKMLDLGSHGHMDRREDGDDGDNDDDDDDDGDTPELFNPDEGKALQFRSYKMEDDIYVLRVRWETKYACEGAADEKDPDEENGGGGGGGGWGFFTWFLIIVFLLAAAYIIFGSWLNYNRYGARGWDLIPHGDTIRDIPYIVKDWGTSVADKFRGDPRGGYSAV